MSVYASVCHEDHGDIMDVAYSCIANEIRLIDWENEDNEWTLMSTEQARHLIELLHIAIERAERGI